MQQFKLLALTDHSTHSEENSLYALLRELRKHPRCKSIHVASRAMEGNHLFFEKMALKNLYASPVDLNFFFYPDGRCFKKNTARVSPRDYDVVLLRLPHPIQSGFWQFLTQQFPHTLFINSPSGIEVTGTKEFLLNFPEVCPPMRMCRTLEDIISFKSQFPVVLKPTQSYGGAGIVKIDYNQVFKAEGGKMAFNKFAGLLKDKPFQYLGVRFLKNVGNGDKRIVVCCGEILGAALRRPAPGNWVCNVAMGGSSYGAEADETEIAIIRHITPALESHGIVFYGIDTLENDNGKRVLSEINTLSIGGLPKIAEYSGRPVVEQAAKLLWNHIAAKLS